MYKLYSRHPGEHCIVCSGVDTYYFHSPLGRIVCRDCYHDNVPLQNEEPDNWRPSARRALRDGSRVVRSLVEVDRLSSPEKPSPTIRRTVVRVMAAPEMSEKLKVEPYIVYGLRRPGGDKFFYVGMTHYSRKRLLAHARRWGRGTFESVLLEIAPSESEAAGLERDWIWRCLNDGHPLKNKVLYRTESLYNEGKNLPKSKSLVS